MIYFNSWKSRFTIITLVRSTEYKGHWDILRRTEGEKFGGDDVCWKRHTTIPV